MVRYYITSWKSVRISNRVNLPQLNRSRDGKICGIDGAKYIAKISRMQPIERVNSTNKTKKKCSKVRKYYGRAIGRITSLSPSAKSAARNRLTRNIKTIQRTKSVKSLSRNISSNSFSTMTI